MLTFDNEQYLFGAGEGTQRALMQRKIPSSVLRAVLVGDGRSSGRTGLPGESIKAMTDVSSPKTCFSRCTELVIRQRPS